MFSFISTAALANVTIDFTNDLSIFLSGMIGLLWVSAGMIAWTALKDTATQPATASPKVTDTTGAEAYRLAA